MLSVNTVARTAVVSRLPHPRLYRKMWVVASDFHGVFGWNMYTWPSVWSEIPQNNCSVWEHKG